MTRMMGIPLQKFIAHSTRSTPKTYESWKHPTEVNTPANILIMRWMQKGTDSQLPDLRKYRRIFTGAARRPGNPIKPRNVRLLGSIKTLIWP